VRVRARFGRPCTQALRGVWITRYLQSWLGALVLQAGCSLLLLRLLYRSLSRPSPFLRRLVVRLLIDAVASAGVVNVVVVDIN
jgi:hypothetical protein